MGFTIGEVAQQVRELIGDWQQTQFTLPATIDAINRAQDLIMRVKAFRVNNVLYDATFSTYPTGTLPDDYLKVTRVVLVRPQLIETVAPEALDEPVRVLDESSLEHEDSVNETWKTARATYYPRRWCLIGNKEFSVVPPFLPPTAVSNLAYRLYYIPQAVHGSLEIHPIDPVIPDYFQTGIKYAAAGYLLEKDTDMKSIQLKTEMFKAFDYHMAGGIVQAAVSDTDS